MPWKPSFEGEVPTLGFAIIDWMRDMLATPGTMAFNPFVPYKEQEDFLLEWYRVSPLTGRRIYYRGVLGRPRGWGKSPLLGAICIVEALGPVVFDGWDADGQPVGKPWSTLKRPLVHVAAVSESQTANTWDPLCDMVREEAPIHDHYTAVPYGAYVDLGWGKIEKVSSSARSIKGAPTVFASLDQTEEWVPSNGGKDLANVMRSNAGKMGGTSLESPNAFIAGQSSVAEGSYNYWRDIQDGKIKDPGLLYDNREAPPSTDLSDYDSLIEGMRIAYGDSSNDERGCVIHTPPCPPGHADLARNVRTIWDPEFTVDKARTDYLNQHANHADAWLSKKTVEDTRNLKLFVDDGELITLGFDGSKGRNRGNADATALIGCRVSDGALFNVGIWEQENLRDANWLPPLLDIDMRVEMAFARWKVVGFYADPSGWNEQVARWEAKYGRRLKVKASQNWPIAAWPRGKDTRVTEYLKNLKQALENGDICHDGNPRLEAHLLNSRLRKTKLGYQIYKAFPESPDKIDAAYAATMAYKARLDALAAGVNKIRERLPTSGRVVVS